MSEHHRLIALPLGTLPWWIAPIGLVASMVMLVVTGLLGLSPLLGQNLQFVAYAVIATLLVFAVTRAPSWPAPRASVRAGLGLSLTGVGRFAAVTLGAVALIWLSSWLFERSSAQAAQSGEVVIRAMGFGQSSGQDLWLILGICALAPIGEEAIYRGLIFRGLFDGLGRLGAKWSPRTGRSLALLLSVALSAWIFADAHSGEGQEAQIYVLLFHGVIYALAYAVSGTIWAAIMAHSISNTLAVLDYVAPWGDALDLTGPNMAVLYAAPVVAFALTALWWAVIPGRSD